MHMCPRKIGTDEADRLDLGCVQDRIDGVMGAVYHRKNTIRNAGFASQLSEDHGSARRPFGWLEYQRVTVAMAVGIDHSGTAMSTSQSAMVCQSLTHRWEVERTDGRRHP